MTGILTDQLAKILTKELDQYGIDVLYDHGQQACYPQNVGEIVSWFGNTYDRKSRLALFDIAIIKRETCKALALIEIEETTDKPKVLIGDVMAILMGDGIKFQGKHDLCIGPWTTLIVLGHYSHSPHLERVQFLEKQMKDLKSGMDTCNAIIGEIVIGLFNNEDDLNAKAKDQIERAHRRFSEAPVTSN